MIEKFRLPSLEGKSCLLVDDDADMREVIGTWLEIFGFETIIEAENGEVAWTKFQEKRPDLLITDLSMPVLTGYALMSKVRDVDKDLPIIVISGWIGEEQLPLLDPYNVQETLFKPFKSTVLHQLIERIFTIVGEDT